LGGFLTKSTDADEAFASFRAFHENIQLFGQLLALGAILLRFTSDASNKVGRRKDIAKWRDELGFDNFDSDIVDETFQSNLVKHLASGLIEEGARW